MRRRYLEEPAPCPFKCKRIQRPFTDQHTSQSGPEASKLKRKKQTERQLLLRERTVVLARLSPRSAAGAERSGAAGPRPGPGPRPRRSPSAAPPLPAARPRPPGTGPPPAARAHGRFCR